MAQGPTSRSSRTSSLDARHAAALLTAEGIRTAMREFGNQPLTGAQVQWGLEHLSLTAASLKALGAEGLLAPFSLSCHDHEGAGA